MMKKWKHFYNRIFLSRILYCTRMFILYILLRLYVPYLSIFRIFKDNLRVFSVTSTCFEYFRLILEPKILFDFADLLATSLLYNFSIYFYIQLISVSIENKRCPDGSFSPQPNVCVYLLLQFPRIV